MYRTLALIGLGLLVPSLRAEAPVELGARRELFVDATLIDRLDNVRLEQAQPRDEGVVVKFDKPWEGLFCGYCTVLHDGPKYRLYYRGLPKDRADGSDAEVTCYAESDDGIHWTKPDLGLFEVGGTKQNNVVLAGATPASHNFSPFIDGRPDVPREQRYKALGGTMTSGLLAFASPDGLHWDKLRAEPVLTKSQVTFPYMFDSQNVAFWSETEKCYVCYFRVFKDKVRRICRTTSKDFVQWEPPVLMEYRHGGESAPIEHLYTNQTHPYFRAPHIYVGLAARFFPGRQVLSDEQAKAIGVNPAYFKDTSDAVLLTTRGDKWYERTSLDGFLRPGIGPQNWVSRTNYPALNVVPIGANEMSFYVNQDYAQPTAHLRRYTLRLDGFASMRAPYRGGELVTKPLTFKGKRLLLNFATSAAGGIRVEVQDEAGKPIPGYSLKESRETIGNEIERAVAWQDGSDVSRLAGKTIRLRFVMKDADLFALRFAE
jgi:hypothetical protein